MKNDMLSWYESSGIERVLENRLAKYNLKLSFPRITYTPKRVSVDRAIELEYGTFKKSVRVRRDFYTSDYNETILFELDGNSEATTYCFKENDRYTVNASCYLYDKRHKALLCSLRKQRDLAFCVSETRASLKITGYFVEGNISRFTELLVDYWVRKFSNWRFLSSNSSQSLLHGNPISR